MPIGAGGAARASRLAQAVAAGALAALLAYPGPGPGAHAAAPPAVTLRQVASGLAAPVHLTSAGDRSGRLFVVEQAGVIRILRGGKVSATPYLDIQDRVSAGGEMGLLSVAFHPRYAATGRFFVNYTARSEGLQTVIAEYRVSRTHPDRADAAERVLLRIPQPYANHNGGLNLFGPDGRLYIGLGDGGAGGDPHGYGQRLNTLLGKLLRLDVDGRAPYGVPPDNPFVGRRDARGEIWAYGLRNPWRFSFDRATGRLLLADVGQNAAEEVNVIQRGGNYGWSLMEGARCFPEGAPCRREGLALPIAVYDHTQGCSITGGHVYRGARVPALAGRYLFGDYCSGRLWALTETAGGRWTMALVAETGLRISSFGEDEDGGLYVVDHAGAVYAIAGP